jgi:hypothetical protein
MILAMQKFFGLIDSRSSDIICNIDVSHSIVHNFRTKYPAIHAEFFTQKAIKNKTSYKTQPNIHV